MQQTGITWPTLWFTLGPAIITGFFTALGSWLLYRSQLKTKVAEIRGQAELRARELMFESYQKRIDRIGEDVNRLVGALYGFAGHLQALTDEKEKREVQVAMLVLIRMIKDPMLDSMSELEQELASVDLAEKRKADLEFVRQTLSINFEQVGLDFGLVYLNFMKAFGLLSALKQELLNKKCEILFDVYLEPKGS